MRRPRLTAIWQLPHLIRFRLTLWYTGLAAVVLAAFVGGVFYEFDQYKFQSYIDTLQQTFNSQVVQLGFPSDYSPRYWQSATGGLHTTLSGSSTYHPLPVFSGNSDTAFNGAPIMFLGRDGKPLIDKNTGEPMTSLSANSVFNNPAAKEGAKRAGKDSTGSPVQTDWKGYHFITIPWSTVWGDRVTAQIAIPTAHIQQQVEDLKRILIYVAGVLLLFSAAGGWLLAGRALKPITDLTHRAQQISAHDLSQRLNLDQADELGHLAATFDDMIARLQEAFERQKRFTSDASHELRTPLTVMQADLSLALARSRSAEEYRQTIESVDEEVTRLTAIVGDLLTLTRIDVDPAGLQHQPVALHELLAGLIKRVRIIAADRAISVSGDSLPPITVIGDSTRLRQLFTNLLDNAVTYTQPGGHVTVTLDRVREGARIRISDTGIGIAPEDVGRIFERFYRANKAREQNAHGTGLGLAISQSVVQAHHGHIFVESTLGEGSTFTVILPADGQRRILRTPRLRTLLPAAESH